MSDSKKSRVRFSKEDELVLLREVVALNPFENFSNWMKVQEGVATATNKHFSLRLVKDHTEHLAKVWQTQDRRNLRKSGTEEQYLEKDQLLQEVCDMMKEFAATKMSKFSAMQIERGVEARNIATEEFWRMSNEGMDCIVIEEEKAALSSSTHNYTLSPPLSPDHSLTLNRNLSPVSNLTASQTTTSALAKKLSLNSTTTQSQTQILTATPKPTSLLTPVPKPNTLLTKTIPQTHIVTRTPHPTFMKQMLTQIPTKRQVETPRPPLTLTPTPIPTSIETPSPTSTQMPTPISTQTPTSSSTETPTPTSTQTQTPTSIKTLAQTCTATPASTSTKMPVKTSNTPAQILTEVLPNSERRREPPIKRSTLLYLQDKSKWQREIEDSKMEMKKKKLKLEEEKLSFDKKEREAKLVMELTEREKKLEIEIKERESRLRMDEAQMQNTTALTSLFAEILKQLKK